MKPVMESASGADISFFITTLAYQHPEWVIHTPDGDLRITRTKGAVLLNGEAFPSDGLTLPSPAQFELRDQDLTFDVDLPPGTRLTASGQVSLPGHPVTEADQRPSGLSYLLSGEAETPGIYFAGTHLNGSSLDAVYQTWDDLNDVLPFIPVSLYQPGSLGDGVLEAVWVTHQARKHTASNLFTIAGHSLGGCIAETAFALETLNDIERALQLPLTGQYACYQELERFYMKDPDALSVANLNRFLRTNLAERCAAIEAALPSDALDAYFTEHPLRAHLFESLGSTETLAAMGMSDAVIDTVRHRADTSGSLALDIAESVFQYRGLTQPHITSNRQVISLSYFADPIGAHMPPELLAAVAGMEGSTLSITPHIPSWRDWTREAIDTSATWLGHIPGTIAKLPVGSFWSR
jgi:hypothetical protein